MAEVRQVLRGLLRTARQRIAPKAENAVFHEHIVAQFRDNASEQDPARVRELLRLAKDYRDYVHAVQHEKELLLSYNIGIDRDARQMQMVRSTAARVGLQLPKQG